MRKTAALVLCVVMLLSITARNDTAQAAVTTGKLSDAPASVDGVRWFPAHPDRHNDFLWEVEFEKEGARCQSFLWEPETNYLNMTYGENGSLTATIQIDANGDGVRYWPRFRTLITSDYPYLDMTEANTVYFDFVVSENTMCNVMFQQLDIPIKLSSVIAKVCGVSDVENSDTDLPPGHYKGSFNFYSALSDLAKEVGTESSVFAEYWADTSADSLQVPSVTFYVVGTKGASVTVNSLFISTPDDTQGQRCTYADTAMVIGKAAAEEMNEVMAAGNPDKPSTTTTTTTTTAATTTTTTAARENAVYLYPMKNADGKLTGYSVLIIENDQPITDETGAYLISGVFDENQMDADAMYWVVSVDDDGVILTDENGQMLVTPYQKQTQPAIAVVTKTTTEASMKVRKTQDGIFDNSALLAAVAGGVLLTIGITTAVVGIYMSVKRKPKKRQ